MAKTIFAVVSLFLLLASGGRISSSTKLQQLSPQDTVVEVPLCQLVKEPGSYNQKLIKVTGLFTHGFENSSIYDPSCGSRFRLWFEYGGTNVPNPISVEGFQIPLIVDDNFKTFDTLLHKRGGLVVHATVVGRFFSGKKLTTAQGKDWWGGYGHMGCCSLFMIEQVVDVDSGNRQDLDYEPFPDKMGINSSSCRNDFLIRDGLFESYIAQQAKAEAEGNSWSFDDPKQIATSKLANILKKDPQIIDLRVTRTAPGRFVYEWKPTNEKAVYVIVVSRPYILSYYSKTNKVAWVAIAAYRSSCDGHPR